MVASTILSAADEARATTAADTEKQVHPRASAKHAIRVRLALGLILLDMLAITAATGFVGWLRLGEVTSNRLTTLLILILPLYFVLAVQREAYRPTAMISATRSTRRACFAMLAASIIAIGLGFVFKASEDLSRVVVVAGTLASCVALVLSRALYARFALARLGGSPDSEIVLIDGIQPPDACTALRIDVEQIGLAPDINDPMMLSRIGGMICHADRVIVACPLERRAVWSLALKGAGVNVEVLAPELDAIGAIGATHYHGTSTALVAVGPLNTVDRCLKRMFDLSIVLLALPMLAPVMILVAIAIKLDSPGPVLFAQSRVGQGNRLFRMLKFRSMHVGKLDHNANKLTTRDDPRVTRVGRFIRKTSLDELPQILNVLLGDMSIVGPRPHATGALAGDSLYWEVSSHYWNRHAVKPGLTGLAQVRGFRGNTETDRDLINRLQADLAYLDSWTIWRDLVLVLQTFRVLVHRNAF